MSGTVENFDWLAKIDGFHQIGKGKSREVFEFFEVDGEPGNEILMAATDCVSAFDAVLPQSAMPGKGVILTQLSLFWFQETECIAPNHRSGMNGEHWPPSLDPSDERARGRIIVVRRAMPLPAECVVRGFLAGSAWREYRRTGHVCGIALPAGLREAEELPEPIFTPSTKAKTGRDENISFDELVGICGGETAERIRDYSLQLYQYARARAQKKDVLIADTKFEFGWDADGGLMLIDELLTPDSSRFWPAENHCPGRPRRSLDKQIVRDHLEKTGWDKKSRPPSLPAEVIEEARAGYLEVCERLTGKPFYEFYRRDVRHSLDSVDSLDFMQ